MEGPSTRVSKMQTCLKSIATFGYCSLLLSCSHPGTSWRYCRRRRSGSKTFTWQAGGFQDCISSFVGAYPP
ncbi:hypothetical protein BDW67DRAFT_162183 [Aspergillus spinulosporus]